MNAKNSCLRQIFKILRKGKNYENYNLNRRKKKNNVCDIRLLVLNNCFKEHVQFVVKVG